MSKTLQTHSFICMGSPCELKLYAHGKNFQRIVSRALARLVEIENKYSRYREDSITTQINSAAGSDSPVELDAETAGLLDYADTLYEQSNGLFDISSGILRKVWNFKSQQLPQPSEIEKLLPLIGWRKVMWHKPYFALPQKGMEIDFGGFVKEYAADQIANDLRASGISSGLVNLGGDIAIVGPHPDGSPWVVGIQHPRESGQAIVKIPVGYGAIATSGDYERFMCVAGKRYSHLLNPHTGHCVQPEYASVTVIADQCLIAGSFSSLAMLKSEACVNWLEGAGVAYLQIDQQMAVSGNITIHKK